MSKVTYTSAIKSEDLVLREVWHAKDSLSAAQGHDLGKFFAETQKREKLSGHPLVEPPKRLRKK